MEYNLAYGKVHAKKRKQKLSKKMLDSMSLKKLKVLAKKYKVSCFKKGTKVCVKKSTLLKRLKKSRSINKILESASKMKKVKSTKRKVTKVKKDRFGFVKDNYPNFSKPLDLSLGKTYGEQLRHYKNIPSTLISGNFQGPANRATGISKGKGNKPVNFNYTQGSLGRSSLPYYYNINKFGQYFH